MLFISKYALESRAEPLLFWIGDVPVPDPVEGSLLEEVEDGRVLFDQRVEFAFEIVGGSRACPIFLI